MSEAILIGTRGWDHDAWQGGFYPAELPAEWRFCYYSNLLRAVLVPAAAWAGATPSTVAQWAEDSDAGFRFVLEPPPLASAVELAAFLRLIEPIASQTDGFLASAASLEPARLDMLLAGLARAHPVCVDLPAGGPSPELSALLAAHRVGRCWHCASEDMPTPGGELLVALSAGGPAPELRRTLEALARWQAPGGRAALFFEGPGAAEATRTARTLAELMGI
ncbi:MAG: DUF72 domain-containing protein [Gammaproteobacteria bacterium]|nr:DUF72 domain-containing protein [Gammaproteobacteria bacterium]